MDVTLLYVRGCPNRDLVEARLREALERLGRSDVTVTRRRVASDAQAVALGFRGSPTILVDGRDPFARSGDPPAGLSCRVYATGRGLAGAPTLAQLVEALR